MRTGTRHPDTMEAVTLERSGPPGVLQHGRRPVPVFDEDQVLVRVRACGVCGHDLLARRGQLGTPLPAVLGHEIAGEVVAVGRSVRTLAPGARVALVQRIPCGRCGRCRDGLSNLCRSGPGFYGENLSGGYAGFVVASELNAVPLPACISFEQGAILSCALGTALRALERAAVRKGDLILITGAGGGVGVHAVQIARHLGARVMALSGSPFKRALLEEAGAEWVVEPPEGETGLRDAVRGLTGDEGADVILEITGAPTFRQSIRALAARGRLVLIGNLEPQDLAFNPGLVILRELALMGSAHATRADLERVVDLVAGGTIRPVVSEVLPLAAAAPAHQRLEQRLVAGRLVLAPAD